MKNLLLCLGLLVLSMVAWGQAPAPATLVDASIPLPGGSTAVYTSSGLAYYRHADGLGSHRVLSSSTGGTPYFDTAYAPFGEDYADATGSCPACIGAPEYTFGSMPQAESTQGGLSSPWGMLYTTRHRTYSAVQGRWISPDPIINPSDPSSLNPYVYVGNSALIRRDPKGLQDDDDDDDDSGGVCDYSDCLDANLIYYGGAGGYSAAEWFSTTGGISGWLIQYNWWSTVTDWYQAASALDMANAQAGGISWHGIAPAANPVGTAVDIWSKGHDDYEPACNGCRLRYGDVRLYTTLGTAMVTGGLGAIGGIANSEVPALDLRTPPYTTDVSMDWFTDKRALPGSRVPYTSTRGGPTNYYRTVFQWSKRPPGSLLPEGSFSDYYEFEGVGAWRQSNHFWDRPIGMTDQEFEAYGGSALDDPRSPSGKLYIFEKPVTSFYWYKDLPNYPK